MRKLLAAILACVIISAGIARAQYSPYQGTPTQTNVACGVASTLAIAAGAAKAFIRIVVPNGAVSSAWFNWAGAAATTVSPSDEIKPGGTIVWRGNSGFLPTAQINCIASTPVTVTLIYN